MPRRFVREVTLSKTDRAILDATCTVVDTIAKSVGPSTEVVLHSLEDLGHSVIRIANGHVSGRGVGSPMTDVGLEILHRREQVGEDVFSYFTRRDDGRLMRMVTGLIRNESGKMIGLLAVNTDLSTSVLDFMGHFLPPSPQAPEVVVERFPPTVRDLVRGMAGDATAKANDERNISPSDRVKKMIFELDRRGAFDVRGTVELVAREVGLSRYTIYNYIREGRSQEGENQLGGSRKT